MKPFDKNTVPYKTIIPEQSFSNIDEEMELKQLIVISGKNNSGKSNLIEFFQKQYKKSNIRIIPALKEKKRDIKTHDRSNKNSPFANILQTLRGFWRYIPKNSNANERDSTDEIISFAKLHYDRVKDSLSQRLTRIGTGSYRPFEKQFLNNMDKYSDQINSAITIFTLLVGLISWRFFEVNGHISVFLSLSFMIHFSGINSEVDKLLMFAKRIILINFLTIISLFIIVESLFSVLPAWIKTNHIDQIVNEVLSALIDNWQLLSLIYVSIIFLFLTLRWFTGLKSNILIWTIDGYPASETSDGSFALIPLCITLEGSYFHSNNFEGLFIVKEPEAHLHPAAQANLADLFLDFIRDPRNAKIKVIVETHSESFLYRLARRICELEEKEENNATVDPTKYSVDLADRIQILICDRVKEDNSDYTKVSVVEISKYGYFLLVDNGNDSVTWPKGFVDNFEEDMVIIRNAFSRKTNL